jgi:hypothetical protein
MVGESDRALMTNTTTENGGLYKYEFMKLPPELQDLIVEGLDTRQITLAKAGKMAQDEGYQITAESIRRYYKRLLSMRRTSEVRNAWLRSADILREQGADKIFQMFITFMMSHLIGGVETGEIDFPTKEFLKLMGDIPQQLAMLQTPANANSNVKSKDPIDVTPVSDEAKRKIREDIYGF